MMTSENIPPSTTAQETQQQRKQAPQKGPQEQQPLKCPRCDSANTKFCYYNNYSLSQPRHFCKTCRRYWTRGGALRNVPIGGGCRKSKKLKPNNISSAPSTISSSAAAAAMEFHLGGLSLPKLHPATAGVYTQFVNSSPGQGFGLDLLPGLGFPPPPVAPTSSVCLSSIESLSTINQEMHWKLQQQRLASLIYGGGGGGGEDNTREEKEPHAGLGVSLFQGLDMCTNNNNNNNRNGTGNDNHDDNTNDNSVAKPTTEWYFDQGTLTSATPTTTTTANSYHNNGVAVEAAGGGGGWSADLHQFSGLH